MQSLYSCFCQVGLYQQAEEDGTAALQAGPNAKALLRRATARSLMFKHQEAILDFRHVLNLEPNNRSVHPARSLPTSVPRFLRTFGQSFPSVLA